MKKNNDWVKDYKKQKQKEDKKKEVNKIDFLETNKKLTIDEMEVLRAMRLKAQHYRKDKIYQDEELKIIKNHYWDLNKNKIYKRLIFVGLTIIGFWILVNL